MQFSFLPAQVKFYDYFERASANLLDAAKQLQTLLDNCCGELDAQVAAITELEHKGDAIVREVTDLLPRTLITPIDADDIQRLISAIDDALDAVEATAARLQIYQVTAATQPAQNLSRLIVQGAEALDVAMKNLHDKKSYSKVREQILRMNEIENQGDRALRDGLVSLVAHRGDMFDFLRWKEIYELLEQTTDRIEDAGDVLQKVIIANA